MVGRASSASTVSLCNTGRGSAASHCRLPCKAQHQCITTPWSMSHVWGTHTHSRGLKQLPQACKRAETMPLVPGLKKCPLLARRSPGLRMCPLFDRVEVLAHFLSRVAPASQCFCQAWGDVSALRQQCSICKAAGEMEHGPWPAGQCCSPLANCSVIALPTWAGKSHHGRALHWTAK